jgi:hypothetical protein
MWPSPTPAGSVVVAIPVRALEVVGVLREVLAAWDSVKVTGLAQEIQVGPIF